MVDHVDKEKFENVLRIFNFKKIVAVPERYIMDVEDFLDLMPDAAN